MKVFRIKELHLSIIFLGMIIGLIIADTFTFYPTSLVKHQQVKLLPIVGFLCFLFFAIHLFLQVHKQRNKRNLFAIINNTENLIWSFDNNYQYLAFNQAFERKMKQIFGYSVKTGGVVWNMKQRKDDFLIWKGLFDRGLQGEKFSVDMDYSEMAGEDFFINVSFNPIYDTENRVKGVGCFLQNITQRLLYEKEINQQNKRFKEIAFLISHTVRAPLSNILGLVEVLDKDDPLNDANKLIVEHIKFSAKQLDDIIRNVVDGTFRIRTDIQKEKVPLYRS